MYHAKDKVRVLCDGLHYGIRSCGCISDYRNTYYDIWRTLKGRTNGFHYMSEQGLRPQAIY